MATSRRKESTITRLSYMSTGKSNGKFKMLIGYTIFFEFVRHGLQHQRLLLGNVEMP